jgi:hypothetical protein
MPPQMSPGANPNLTDDQIAAIAADGYLFGYPLVLMDMSRQVMTAVTKPNALHAPKNQFNVSLEFPTPAFTDVVAPNVDTLYSSAWLDLRQQPIVLGVPDTGQRYYLMEMLDGWTNVFASPGTRTSGNRARHFAILGPSWQGQLPAGVQAIKSPTAMVWIIGRTKTDGPADYPAVRALKAKYALTPLSEYGSSYTPPPGVAVDPTLDTKTAPSDQVSRMPAAEFFARLARLMQDNPPAGADAPIMERLAQIGVVPGAPFDLTPRQPAFAQAVERGVAGARSALVAESRKSHGTVVNGWDMLTNLGRYGTDYPMRALVALLGLGANLPEDAVYPHAEVDDQGHTLTGANRYCIHFDKRELPPVDAFWSLTLYDSRQLLNANPIDRYALGDRDPLRYEPDGSLNLYVQHDSPGQELESNWLPAPENDFSLYLRLYQPRREVLDGAWHPPPIHPLQQQQQQQA